MTLLELANNATYMIKMGQNSRYYGKHDYCSWEKKILEDGSIGIDYRLTRPMNDVETKTGLIEMINKNRLENNDPVLTKGSKWPYYIDMFINKVRIGDTVIIVKDINIAVYMATIESECYFSNESTWVDRGHSPGGFFHRRRIGNIQKLPTNSLIDKMSMAAIKKCPEEGWGLS